MNKSDYLTLVAIEECAEIQQALSKAVRFGFDDHHPDCPDKTNEDDVLHEFYQLTAMIEELQRQHIIRKPTDEAIRRIKEQKLSKVSHYMAYSRQRGRLD